MQYCSYSIGLDFYHHSHPQLVVVFLWFHPFILSGVISPLISSSILGTYQTGEFIFQCSIFLPFNTVHGVLNARILKWFAIPFSSGPHSIRPLHHDPSVLGGPTWQLKAEGRLLHHCQTSSPVQPVSFSFLKALPYSLV